MERLDDGLVHVTCSQEGVVRHLLASYVLGCDGAGGLVREAVGSVREYFRVEADTPYERVRKVIRDGASPRHVPDEIIAVPAIPHTRTGKKLEVPVKRLLQGGGP